MYEVSCPIPGTRFFKQFETLTPEQAKAELLNAWSTLDQQVYNATHTTCQSCKGRGYKVYRTRDHKTVRENVGCQTCRGTGAVPKMWPARA